MKTKVKTVWGPGIVSVADKYVQQALKLKEGLDIECNGAVMSITYEKLAEKKPRDANFRDRFGRPRIYKLFDFFWEGKK